MLAIEAVLAQLSLFEGLRPDEVGRIAGRFRVETIAPGETRVFDALPEAARLVVAVSGAVELEVDGAAGTLRSDLEPGDRHGDVGLLTGGSRAVRLTAHD